MPVRAGTGTVTIASTKTHHIPFTITIADGIPNTKAGRDGKLGTADDDIDRGSGPVLRRKPLADLGLLLDDDAVVVRKELDDPFMGDFYPYLLHEGHRGPVDPFDLLFRQAAAEGEIVDLHTARASPPPDVRNKPIMDGGGCGVKDLLVTWHLTHKSTYFVNL
jgi:hypothetical protein